MLLIIQNVLGWIYAHKGTALIAVLSLLVLIFGVLTFRGCGKKPVQLNEVEIQKAQQAIAANDRKQMINVLAESNARQAATDQTVDNAKAAANDAATQARKDAEQMSNEELAAELERRAKE